MSKKKSRHKVKTDSGEELEASVEHRSSEANQFDFYVPKKIWKTAIVRDFFDALSQLGGATVFDEEIGIWKGAREKTQVFRLVVRKSDRSVTRVRKTLRREIGKLLASLSVTKSAQETMMFTETLIRVYTAEKVQIVGQKR